MQERKHQTLTDLPFHPSDVTTNEFQVLLTSINFPALSPYREKVFILLFTPYTIYLPHSISK